MANCTSRDKVRAIMRFYNRLLRRPDYAGLFDWTNKRRRFTLEQANSFFVGVMLDQGQDADRAWEGGEHLVENHFGEPTKFWETITQTPLAEIREICRTGYEGSSYAINYQANKFPEWLKNNARLMVRKYGGDPRKIWALPAERVEDIHVRFREFEGIGMQLATMAQFILVRNFGVAGGKDSQSYMSVKVDEHVRRVLYRLGITEHDGIAHTQEVLQELDIRRPADFDASVWVIGREYCAPNDPDCVACPLRTVCAYA